MASHWRTARLTSGVQPPAGPHIAHDTPRDLYSFSPGFLFFVMVVAPLICVGLIVLVFIHP